MRVCVSGVEADLQERYPPRETSSFPLLSHRSWLRRIGEVRIYIGIPSPLVVFLCGVAFMFGFEVLLWIYSGEPLMLTRRALGMYVIAGLLGSAFAEADRIDTPFHWRQAMFWTGLCSAIAVFLGILLYFGTASVMIGVISVIAATFMSLCAVGLLAILRQTVSCMATLLRMATGLNSPSNSTSSAP